MCLSCLAAPRLASHRPSRPSQAQPVQSPPWMVTVCSITRTPSGAILPRLASPRLASPSLDTPCHGWRRIVVSPTIRLYLSCPASPGPAHPCPGQPRDATSCPAMNGTVRQHHPPHGRTLLPCRAAPSPALSCPAEPIPETQRQASMTFPSSCANRSRISLIAASWRATRRLVSRVAW
jgi:hypothetical protein